MLAALEDRACSEGVLTLFLGSDDDHGGTTLFGHDLWSDAVGHAGAAEATAHGHALPF